MPYLALASLSNGDCGCFCGVDVASGCRGCCWGGDAAAAAAAACCERRAEADAGASEAARRKGDAGDAAGDADGAPARLLELSSLLTRVLAS